MSCSNREIVEVEDDLIANAAMLQTKVEQLRQEHANLLQQNYQWGEVNSTLQKMIEHDIEQIKNSTEAVRRAEEEKQRALAWFNIWCLVRLAMYSLALVVIVYPAVYLTTSMHVPAACDAGVKMQRQLIATKFNALIHIPNRSRRPNVAAVVTNRFVNGTAGLMDVVVNPRFLRRVFQSRNEGILFNATAGLQDKIVDFHFLGRIFWDVPVPREKAMNAMAAGTVMILAVRAGTLTF